jgi:pyruvate-formate lyase-activating enzyme
MTSKIFYGAGANAARNLSRFIEKVGEPVCFVDADRRKWGECFLDIGQSSENSSKGYVIYSLSDAIDKFPDYELWLTPAPENLLSVSEQLKEQGIPADRIRYCEDVEYRRGCRHLGELIVVGAAGIQPCCTPYHRLIAFSTDVHTEESVKSCVEEFRQWLNQTIGLMRSDAPTDCDGCALLKWGYWPIAPKIKWLNAGAGFADTICNCRCIYCNQGVTAFSGSNQHLNSYDIVRILSGEFEDSIEWIALADGEITALPHRDKLLRLGLEKGWNATVCTNALMYNDKITQILSRKGSSLNVSLDSGTDETYKAVKGIDGFQRVISNLKKYAVSKCRLELKYILLPGINDSLNDINGFIDLANILKADRVYLSHDLFNLARAREAGKSETSITEQQFVMYAHFAARCKESGLPVYYSADYFTAEDCSRMNNLCDPI